MMSFDPDRFRDLYPFESHYFARSGLRYHYVDEGQGDPVVMVHGNPTWSFYYRRLAEALRGTHRVVVPDHIGMGLSDKPSDDRYTYRLASRVDDLEALIEHLGLTEKVTLVVHDWGGAIGLGWAARHPERVKRLVILNTAAFPMPAERRLPWQLAIIRNWSFGGWAVQAFNAFALPASFIAVKAGMRSAVRRAYLAPYDSWSNRLATRRFVEDIPLVPTDPSYDALIEAHRGLANFRQTPALICWGLADFVFDAGYLEMWERELPTAEVHRFPAAGHYVLEDAADDIVPLVTSFLQRNPIS
jgi:pimeloyl-ACP methyl ester carboxylesterase